MATIRKLDPSTILKLAAGEIIDRPVSIVKELIENAIDASASKINIAISKGGISDILVADNGHGIAHQDMAYTIEAHATSKLTEFNDLQQVLTMGFRGEALASIAEVAQVKIESFNDCDPIGTQLIKGPNEPLTLKTVAREKGTTVCVSHLFKTVPVRFRFLKSATAEATAITRLVQTFSLHYPHIQFELTHNGAVSFKTKLNAPLTEQFGYLMGIDEVISFNKASQGIRVHGVMGAPNHAFKQRNKCWFSVNGRLVKSPLFFKAVDQALCDVVPKFHYPALVCNIDIESCQVDINIHPQKVEVKFACADDVFVAIKRAVQSAVHSPAPVWENAREVMAQPVSFSQFDLRCNQTLHPLSSNGPDMQPLVRQEMMLKSIESIQSTPPIQALHAPKPSATASIDAQYKWVSFKQKYIIVPLTTDVLIFDQHAVHERILYDEFKAQVMDGQPVSLPLLLPEYIQMDASDMLGMDALLDSIRSLGIDIDRFDDESLIIREVPQCFYGVNMHNWLAEWINAETLSECMDAPLPEQQARLQLKACKAAIKAGQRLSDSSVQALISTCINTTVAFTCPHGRPLYLKLSEQQLDAMFLRL